MTFKKAALIFCVLLCQVLYSCGIGSYSLDYIFDNKSSYTIQITLRDPYKFNTDSSDDNKRTAPFSVYRSNVTTIYVQNNGIVDFQWTTYYASDNPKVYCVTDGKKATFKDR